jgi:hypothetical protein
LSASPTEPYYDWIFHYKLSRVISCKESIDDPTIKLTKDSKDNLRGFDITIKNESESNARKTSEKRANNLQRILITVSGMALNAHQTSHEAVPKMLGLKKVGKTMNSRYDIEGAIDKIDLTDPIITRLIAQDKNPCLEYLSNAVVHKSQGRFSDSIKEAFRILEGHKSVKDYCKFKCIRNILSHKEGVPLHKDTMNDFIKYFDPNVHTIFDFKQYDLKNRIIILDHESNKTKHALGQIARDLISEAKSIMGL